MQSSEYLDIPRWLSENGFGKYIDKFNNNKIDTLESLLTLDDSKLKAIGLSSEEERSRFFRALSSTIDIPKWLRDHDLADYEDCMRQNGVLDWRIIRTLDDTDLDKLCFKHFDKKRFYHAVAMTSGRDYRIVSDHNIDKALGFIKD